MVPIRPKNFSEKAVARERYQKSEAKGLDIVNSAM
jgi:hypothetical protein